jgi:hypothetical protein
MPLGKNHPRPKKGGPMLAADFVSIAETCDWISRLSVSPPLELASIGGGPRIRMAPFSGAELAISNGTISARSGTTAGTGFIYYVYDMVASGVCTLQTGTNSTAVFNYSGTAGGIPTGKYCWLATTPNGNLFVVSAEC